MPINVDAAQALTLLGLRTLELEQLRSQCEQIADDFNKMKQENEELKQKLASLEMPLLREVGHG